MNSDVVIKAREYLGTKYVHQGRVKNVGVDCIGLVICVARELGLVAQDFDRQDYTHQPNPAVLLDGLLSHMTEVPLADVQPGDVLLMNAGGANVHVGIKTDVGLLHAFAPAGRVVEHSLRAQFATAVQRAFRVPGSV